ncbi:MAG: hypothetical protein O2931_01485 [Planctomycetota bacterium]|nr:hypothetical protein [Planctomycetota bacterium]MDA1177445.1 hypothetical protein [Planctomycetota bacterium]
MAGWGLQTRDDRWGPSVSYPGHCVHPVSVSVGSVSPAWGRWFDKTMRVTGLVHWKIAKIPYLPWLPQHAIAMMVVRHVDRSQDLGELCHEVRTVHNSTSRGMVVVLPTELIEWQWLLRECGALDVQAEGMANVPRIVRTIQRFFVGSDHRHPDRTVPACWLAPAKGMLRLPPS